MRVFPHKAVLFSCNDFYKSLFASVLGTKFLASFVAGSCAGLTATAVTFPLDIYRTRMSASMKKNAQYSSVVNFLVVTIKSEGFRGFYKGMTLTLIGAIPYEGIKFAAYDLLKRAYNSNDENERWVKSPALNNALMGAVAGSIAGVMVYPNDTVRRLMQMQGVEGNAVYGGVVDAWKDTYRKGGIPRFFRGVIPYTLRMAPNAAIQFSVYETLKPFLS
jgi:solute carrier family 25 phosphate transporter 23/24/25/41